jgi:hypothetical protein
VIGRCLPRHRNTEFLKFLRTIDREVPPGLNATKFRRSGVVPRSVAHRVWFRCLWLV